MRTSVAFLLISTLLAAQDRPDVAAVLRQGTELVAKGQLTAAQELYETALRGFRDDPDLTFELGMVYFRQHNWAKAVESYKSCLSSRPEKVKPLFYLAEAYFMESNLDLARETIAQAAQIAPNDPQVCQKYGEYLSLTVETRREGLAWLQKARRLSPSLARIDFEIGKTQFELTDFQSAVSSFEMALKNNSSDGQSAFLLAESWANLNEWQKARKNYALALAQGYVNGSAYYGLGRALVELEEFAAAVPPLQRVVALQPSLVQAHFQLARTYRQLGRTQEARQEARLFGAMSNRIDTALEWKGPEEESAWKQVKPLLEVDKEKEALELLARLSLAKRLDRQEPHYLLGVMYYSLGRKEDAIRMLRIARTADPNTARIAAYLGLVELASEETDAAEDSLQAALALDSTEALALVGIGTIRYQQKRWGDAAEYLEKSRTADPGTLYMLCDAYFRTGQKQEALLTAAVIRALGSDNKSLLDAVNELVSLHAGDRESPAL